MKMQSKQIKKLLFFSSLLLVLSVPVQAQMMDLMGAMAVGGAQTTGAVKSIGTANQKLKFISLLNALQMKIVDITMTYGGEYQNMVVSSLNEGQTKIVFYPVEEGRYFEAFISGINQSLCQELIRTPFDTLVKYRIVTNGTSQTYRPNELRNNTGLCMFADEMALIFQ